MAITIHGLVSKLEATEKSEYCTEDRVLRNNAPSQKAGRALGGRQISMWQGSWCIFQPIFGKPMALFTRAPNHFSDLLAFQLIHLHSHHLYLPQAQQRFHLQFEL
jgi:hypothetical protein